MRVQRFRDELRVRDDRRGRIERAKILPLAVRGLRGLTRHVPAGFDREIVHEHEPGAREREAMIDDDRTVRAQP